MSTLIKRRRIVADDWRVVGLPNDPLPDPLPADGDLIVPLAVWQGQQPALLGRRGRTGVWLEPSDDPAALFSAGPIPELIAIRFPAFTDGRGYSSARLLRERHGFRGELRAIGDVLKDTLSDLARCGFDAFELHAGQDAEEALAAFGEFTEVYQAAADQGPLFARRFPSAGTPS